MALRLTLKARERHETIWSGDEALGQIDDAAFDEWTRDGEARHLLPFVKPGEEATIFHWVTLDHDQSRFVGGIEAEHLVGENMVSVTGIVRSYGFCFRIGIRFPPGVLGEELTDKITGRKIRPYVMYKNIRMLSEEAVDAVNRMFPGMVDFYGKLIREATFPSAAEKKASSLPSTLPKSSEDQSKTPGTAAANSAEQPAV